MWNINPSKSKSNVDLFRLYVTAADHFLPLAFLQIVDLNIIQPPLPWREQIEKSRLYRSTYSWDDFNSQQHKSRLQVFQVD